MKRLTNVGNFEENFLTIEKRRENGLVGKVG